ncbi:MAG: aspartyl protease family protein [Chthoniobacterales bacterium]
MRERLTRIALGLAAIALGSTAAGAATQVDLIDCSGLPGVTVQIGTSKPVKLLLDTGNAVSILNLNDAKSLGLSVEPYKTRDGKVIPDYFTTTVENAALGALGLTHLTFLVVDLQKAIDQGTFPAAAGTICYTALKDRVVTIDYLHHKLQLSEAGAEVTPPETAGTLSFPTFGHRGPAIVTATGFLVNGQPVTIQIDTLFTGTMLIYSTSVDKLGLKTEAGSTKIQKFPFTDGGVDMVEGKAKGESFANKDLMSDAPLYFATEKVHQPDGMFDGTVGQALFNGRSVTLDFHTNRFWVD